MNDIASFIDIYVDRFSSVSIDDAIFAEFLIVLGLFFILRFLLLYKIEDSKKCHRKSNLKSVKLYFVGHCLLEYLCSAFITYGLIVLTNSKANDVILNMIICPAVGILASIYIDTKFIVPLEDITKFGLTNNSKSKKEPKNSESTPPNTININIGDLIILQGKYK